MVRLKKKEKAVYSYNSISFILKKERNPTFATPRMGLETLC
jgi:hypothetical protein